MHQGPTPRHPHPPTASQPLPLPGHDDVSIRQRLEYLKKRRRNWELVYQYVTKEDAECTLEKIEEANRKVGVGGWVGGGGGVSGGVVGCQYVTSEGAECTLEFIEEANQKGGQGSVLPRPTPPSSFNRLVSAQHSLSCSFVMLACFVRSLQVEELLSEEAMERMSVGALKKQLVELQREVGGAC